jgi:hypothetical protein
MKLSSICIVASTLSGFTAQETSAAHLRANGAAHKSREAGKHILSTREIPPVV